MKKKFRSPWLHLILGLLFLIGGYALTMYFVALGNPAKYNWRADYLQGEAIDAYLHTPEAIVHLVFLIGSIGFFLALFFDLLFRKKASHILLVELGTLWTLAYYLARSITSFQIGSVHVLTGLIYLAAFLTSAVMGILFFKKALDGDNLSSYWVFLIASLVLGYFASAGNNSYSILSAYSHNGDFTYWFSYASSRLMIGVFALCAYVNLHFDFCAEEEAPKAI